MRWSSRALAITAALVAGPVAAEPADVWYRIFANGVTIGWEHDRRTDDGSWSAERMLSYRVHEHEPVSLHSNDNSGAMAEIEAAFAAPRGQTARADTSLRLFPDAANTLGRWRGERLVAVYLAERDASGAVVRIVEPGLGTDRTYERSAMPLDTNVKGPPPSIPHPLLTSPFTIGAQSRKGHVRYLFGALPGNLALPETGEQSVDVTAAGNFRLDVCANCGAGLSTAPRDLARWRQPSPWLESAAPELTRAVRRIASQKLSDTRKMALLGRLARVHLPDVDSDGHYSALAAWKRRRGDCTEDATLLAALARASGIPARVASGLAYERERYHGATNAFLPHSWTLAYVDGAWRSFDISTPDGFDATHIALAIGDGEPAAIQSATVIAALLDWQSMAEVRSRSADQPAR